MAKKKKGTVTQEGDKTVIDNARTVSVGPTVLKVWWGDGTYTEVLLNPSRPQDAASKVDKIVYGPMNFPDSYHSVPPIKKKKYEVVLTEYQLAFLKAIMTPMGNHLGGVSGSIASALDYARLR